MICMRSSGPFYHWVLKFFSLYISYRCNNPDSREGYILGKYKIIHTVKTKLSEIK